MHPWLQLSLLLDLMYFHRKGANILKFQLFFFLTKKQKKKENLSQIKTLSIKRASSYRLLQ